MRGECEIPRDSVASSLGRYGSSEKRVKQNSLSATRLSLRETVPYRSGGPPARARAALCASCCERTLVCMPDWLPPEEWKKPRRARSSDATPLRMKWLNISASDARFHTSPRVCDFDSAKKVARDQLRGLYLLFSDCPRFLREARCTGSQLFFGRGRARAARGPSSQI